MPAQSKAQRRLMAMALRHPELVYKKNQSILSMTGRQLRDYAKTSEKKLPKHKNKKSR